MSTKTTKTKKLKSSKASVSKSTSRSKTIKATIRHHKLLSFLTLIIILIATNYGYIKYQDWDNAQLIKGLARDFPSLVEKIEQETGLELDIKSSCLTTTEKFSDGVKTCGVSVGYVGLDNAEEKIISISKVVEPFSSQTEFINNAGVDITYRSKKSCQLWFASPERFHMGCLTAVRGVNIDLAREEFGRLDWNDPLHEAP